MGFGFWVLGGGVCWKGGGRGVCGCGWGGGLVWVWVCGCGWGVGGMCAAVAGASDEMGVMGKGGRRKGWF